MLDDMGPRNQYCDLAINASNDNKWYLLRSLISIGPGLKYFYFVINKASYISYFGIMAFIIIVTYV